MKLLLLVPLLVLSGCSLLTPPEPLEIYVPVLKELVVPETVRPDLIIDTMSEEAKAVDGEIAKAYVASVMQLLDYINNLETILKFVKEQNTPP